MRIKSLSGLYKMNSALLALLLFLSGISLAQGTQDNSMEQGTIDESRAEKFNDLDADEIVRQEMSEWKNADPIARQLITRSDVSILEGVELTALSIHDNRWGKARSLAYTKAFAQAINEYVSRTRKNVTMNFLHERFEQDLDESEFVYRAGESEAELINRVLTKTAVLGERNLDSALVESGMSQEEIDRLTPPQKKVALSDNLTRRVTTSAAGSASGLVPIKTFEAYDNEGNSAIGVVVASSIRMQQLAKQIATHKEIRPDAERLRKSIADQIAVLSDEDLISEFGPRIWWDERGYPTIVAFGQWAWSSEGLTKRKKARRRSFAFDQASSDAIAHLTMFVNASTRFTEVSEQGEVSEEFSLIWRDGTVTDQEPSQIADRFRQFANVNSAADFTGIKILRKWSRAHPYLDGHELVGTIVSWSPAQEDQVRAELGLKKKHQVLEKNYDQKANHSAETSISHDLMDPADF